MTRRAHWGEWRVSWRREGWLETTSKSRIFARHHAARRFYDRLLDEDRPDLAPVTSVKVEGREVGEWRPLTPRAKA